MHDVFLILMYLLIFGLVLAAVYQAFLGLDEMIQKAREAKRKALPQPKDADCDMMMMPRQ